MRNLFLILFAIVFGLAGACTNKPEQTLAAVENMQVDAPRVIAVLSYAQWCASCKILTPKIDKMRTEYELRGIEFIDLDYSARNDDAFYAQAQSLGFEAPVRDYFGDNIITGRLMLMTPEGRVLTRPLNMNHTMGEIRNRFDKALSAAG